MLIRRTVKERQGGGFYFSTPKTAKSNRPIDPAPDTIAALKAHRWDQLEAKLKIRDVYRESDLIFANEIGDPLLISNVRRRFFDPLVTDAGLPKIRLYDLGHTTATLLLSEGEHPKVVPERLGPLRQT